MDKKESLNKENLKFDTEEKSSSGKRQGKALPNVSTLLFGVVKFILGVCFLPFVWGISVALYTQLNAANTPEQAYFWYGALALIVVHLFIWEPQVIYDKGHRLLEIVFGFFQPLVKVAPYLLPIYTIILLIAYAIVSPLVNSETLTNVVIFFSGFTIALHLVFAARTLRSKKDDFLKGNYIFGFSFVYIITLLFVALCFLVFSQEFSYSTFFADFLKKGADVFYTVFKQLFMVG